MLAVGLYLDFRPIASHAHFAEKHGLRPMEILLDSCLKLFHCLSTTKITQLQNVKTKTIHHISVLVLNFHI